jgi:hypothetical protein
MNTNTSLYPVYVLQRSRVSLGEEKDALRISPHLFGTQSRLMFSG